MLGQQDRTSKEARIPGWTEQDARAMAELRPAREDRCRDGVQ